MLEYIHLARHTKIFKSEKKANEISIIYIKIEFIISICQYMFAPNWVWQIIRPYVIHLKDSPDSGLSRYILFLEGEFHQWQMANLFIPFKSLIGIVQTVNMINVYQWSQSWHNNQFPNKLDPSVKTYYSMKYSNLS